MKYYKRLKNPSTGLMVGKIYSEEYSNKELVNCYNGSAFKNEHKNVALSVKYNPDLWQEVPEYQYYEQEGLPERWKVLDCTEVSEWAAKTFSCGNWEYTSQYLCIEQNLFPNWNCFKFTLEKSKDYTEISFETFKRLILKQNDMEQKEIIGWKLKKDCEKFKQAINLIIKEENDFPLLEEAGVLTLWFDEVYQEEFKVGDWVITKGYSNTYDGKALKITRIYKGFDEADYINFEPNKQSEHNFSPSMIERKATPSEIEAATKPKVKELYFGDVKFTIKQGNDFAITSHGNIPKSDIKKAIDYIKNPPSLKGYSLKIYDDTEGEGYTIAELNDSNNMSIAFGCTSGKMSELEAIYNAFE